MELYERNRNTGRSDQFSTGANARNRTRVKTGSFPREGFDHVPFLRTVLGWTVRPERRRYKRHSALVREAVDCYDDDDDDDDNDDEVDDERHRPDDDGFMSTKEC